MSDTRGLRSARPALAGVALMIAAAGAGPATGAERTDAYDRLFNRGYEHVRRKEYDDAEKVFRQAIRLKEATGLDDNAVHNALGWVLFMRGDLEEAEQQYLIGVEHERQNSAALNRRLLTNLGFLYYSLGNLGKAEHYLDRAADGYGSESADRLRKEIRTVVAQKMLSDQRRAGDEIGAALPVQEQDDIRDLARHRITISVEVGDYIGQKVWYNEGAGKNSNLINWNEGEDHLSVGIGHFIWYPKGYEGPFTESFPALLDRIEHTDTPVPQWLREDRDSPWATREEMLAAREANAPKFVDLMAFIEQTVPYQVEHLVERLNDALPKMVATLHDPSERRRVIHAFLRVAKKPDGAPDPDGVYALLDYVNFKGEGTSPSERYKGQGWGLLDVLAHMDPEAEDPLRAFVESAKAILERRIANAPQGKNDARWRRGWFNRLDTYLPS